METANPSMEIELGLFSNILKMTGHLLLNDRMNVSQLEKDQFVVWDYDELWEIMWMTRVTFQL